MLQPHQKTSGLVRARIAEDVLLADLLRVARQLNQSSLSQSDYGEFGKFSVVNICRRFGSWKAALLRVNLEPAHFMNISADVLLKDIRGVARKLKTNRLRYSQYAAMGKYSRKIVYRLFGRWQSAAEAAGLEPVIDRPRSGRDLLENLQRVCAKLGRYPLWEEMRPPLSKFGASAYTHRFGNFKTAVALCLEGKDLSRGFKRRGPRTINLRLRFMVFQRDRFRCCACGRSPATHDNVFLQVDHIVPWSAGGETFLGNLQTLCRMCNQGKSDLPWVVTSRSNVKRGNVHH